MLDEPTAGMSADEVPAILDLLVELKEEQRHTVLLVEHKLNVIYRLADRILVLHNGRLIADGSPSEVMSSPVVRDAYLGRRGGSEVRH
jgi:branched-chain amino acid transport system ATP-binding protein